MMQKREKHAGFSFLKRIGYAFYRRGISHLLLGGVTGLFAGLIVTIYNILASYGESFSRGAYGYLRENPAWIPLLFVTLLLGAFLISVVVKFIPMICGSGIPQTEGAARGVVKYNWWQVLTGMFAASLFTIFLGLSAGSEGPSLQIGGAVGMGVGKTFRLKRAMQRYQVTGGASAGLAVAFNAPITGLVFAFEEAHKRFTPEIFICAFSSVVTGLTIRNLLRPVFGLPVTSTFTTFVLNDILAEDLWSMYGYIVLAALVCGFAGVLFYTVTLRCKRFFTVHMFWKGFGNMAIPFVLAGVFGLITVYAMGGGHELISDIGTMGGTRESAIECIFGSPVLVTLIVVLVIKFSVSVLNMGIGVPCGVFIPMLAIGACIGGVMSGLFSLLGMPATYADLLVMICMATFFTTIVKAPITGVVMVVELTWSFTSLLPVLLGVAIGYMISEVFRTKPIYEVLLDIILESGHFYDNHRQECMTMVVMPAAPACEHAIRDLLWPSNLVVSHIRRGEGELVPDGETVLLEGDVLDIQVDTPDRKDSIEEIEEIVGRQKK